MVFRRSASRLCFHREVQVSSLFRLLAPKSSKTSLQRMNVCEQERVYSSRCLVRPFHGLLVQSMHREPGEDPKASARRSAASCPQRRSYLGKCNGLSPQHLSRNGKPKASESKPLIPQPQHAIPARPPALYRTSNIHSFPSSSML